MSIKKVTLFVGKHKMYYYNKGKINIGYRKKDIVYFFNRDRIKVLNKNILPQKTANKLIY